MKSLFLALVVSLIFIALPAMAQVGHDLDPEGDHGCAEDMNTDDCFETGTGTAGGGKDKCIRATNYNTCILRCDCKYQEMLQKCKQQILCRNAAAANKSACEGECLSDWMP